MSKLILYNRCKSQASLENSIVGNNGSVTATINYAAGKFGNGMYAGADNSGCAEFGNVGLVGSGKGEAECWATARADSDSADDVDWLLYLNDSTKAWSNRVGVFLNYSTGTSFIQASLRSNNGGANLNITHNVDWSAGDKLHIKIVWDDSGGIEGSYYLVVYLNGIRVAQSASVFAFSDTLTLTAAACLYFGGVVFATQRSNLTIIDQIKIWDGVKDNAKELKARDVKRFGLNDSNVIL